jgi:hypothetical protein
MRRALAVGAVLAGSLVPCVATRGQALGGPAFSTFGMSDGLYKSFSVPGIGPGGPGLLMYFPSTGGSASFTPSPMAWSVAGLQLPVTGTGGSVYLPSANSPWITPPAGGGLALPSPRTPVATPVPVRVRPAAAKKAARADEAKKAVDAPADPPRAPVVRSTLKERRGIR